MIPASKFTSDTFINETQLTKIQRACDLADIFLHDFLGIIKQESHFTYTNMTVNQVYTTIKEGLDRKPRFKVRLYTSKWPWSKAIGYTTKGSSTIFLNSRMLDSRTVYDYVNTLTHESLHLKELGGFSHGSNSPRGKEQSVPYRIGQLAEEFSKGQL